MKSETVTIQHLFQDRRQYCVPFYQRAYVWTLDDQWEQLWDDIRDKAEGRISNNKTTPHFLGAVVLEPQAKDGLMGVDILHIIDGQQRLTTLQFVLASMQLVLRNAKLPGFFDIVSGCLRNGNVETMRDAQIEIFKVWPTFRDRPSYKLALTAQSSDDLRMQFPAHFTQNGELRKIGAQHPPALAALWYFTRCFEDWIIRGDGKSVAARAEALTSAILRDLKVVCIVLEKEDDAQIIFETLNGRGAQLHATDLIRNYLFMRADREGANSENLYETLWSPFETSYWSEEQRRGRMKKPRLEWLIHTSLQAELHEEIDLSRLYHEYRRFATGGEVLLRAEQQLLTLRRYASYYKELISGTGDMPIALFGRRIAPYDITTLHPLALMIAASNIEDQAKHEMFGDLMSYVVRRNVCGLTQKNYNNVFLTTLRQLYTNGISPASMRSILSALAGDASRWPSDAEFRGACINAPLYPGSLETPKIRAFLTEIEGQLRRVARVEEPIPPNLDQLDVDHIMPRAWSTYWTLPDGSSPGTNEISEVDLLVTLKERLNDRQTMIASRQAAIPTLGNLTLLNLSVNREAQNFVFRTKRDLLIVNTNLRLNIPQIPLQDWNEGTIKARAETLADASLKLWPRPSP